MQSAKHWLCSCSKWWMKPTMRLVPMSFRDISAFLTFCILRYFMFFALQKQRSTSCWNRRSPSWLRCHLPTCWRNGGGRCLQGTSLRMNGWSAGGRWSKQRHAVYDQICHTWKRKMWSWHQKWTADDFSRCQQCWLSVVLTGGSWSGSWSPCQEMRLTVTHLPSSMYLETILSSGTITTVQMHWNMVCSSKRWNNCFPTSVVCVVVNAGTSQEPFTSFSSRRRSVRQQVTKGHCLHVTLLTPLQQEPSWGTDVVLSRSWKQTLNYLTVIHVH